MTSSTRTRTGTTLRLRNPGDLIAGVPHLLGFHPADSLVLISLTEDDDGLGIGVTLRADLPREADQQSLAAQLLAPVVAHKGSTVVALVVCAGKPEPWPAPLPHSTLIAALEEVFSVAEVRVRHAVWAESTKDRSAWRCYDEPDCGGALPDSASSPFAAANAVAGNVTFASREEMRALLDPDPEEALTFRTALIDALLDGVEGENPPGFGSPTEALHAIYEAVYAAADHRLELSDEDIARFAMALADQRVRDACLATVLWEQAEGAESLWLALTKGVPGPERAEPAVLLAFAGYLRGDGALASMALEVAEAADGAHRLGRMLRTALDTGLPPAELAVIALDGAAEAHRLLETE